MEHFTTLQRAIEHAGFFGTLQSDDAGGVRLVLASRRTRGKLCGNSFWLGRRGDHWYLVTWTPAYYRVPGGADLVSLCVACLRVSPSPLPEIPQEIVRRFGLVEVREADYDRA